MPKGSPDGNMQAPFSPMMGRPSMMNAGAQNGLMAGAPPMPSGGLGWPGNQGSPLGGLMDWWISQGQQQFPGQSGGMGGGMGQSFQPPPVSASPSPAPPALPPQVSSAPAVGWYPGLPKPPRGSPDYIKWQRWSANQSGRGSEGGGGGGGGPGH